MSFLDFVLWATAITIVMWAATAIWTISGSDDIGFGIGMVSALFTLIIMVCWIVFAASHNREVKDRNFCESLTKRGHQTQFFVYNQFNHECYILVDKQWILIDDSPFGNNKR